MSSHAVTGCVYRHSQKFNQKRRMSLRSKHPVVWKEVKCLRANKGQQRARFDWSDSIRPRILQIGPSLTPLHRIHQRRFHLPLTSALRSLHHRVQVQHIHTLTVEAHQPTNAYATKQPLPHDHHRLRRTIPNPSQAETVARKRNGDVIRL